MESAKKKSCQRLYCKQFILLSAKVLLMVVSYIYFIPSSEFNAYLTQIKVILSVVKTCIFLPVTYAMYIFSNRGCFDNLGLNFLQKRSGMHISCLT